MLDNVLLIQSSTAHENPPRQYPYGLAILSSVLKSKGISVQCYDGNLDSEQELSQLLGSNAFEFVGISGMITSFDYQKRTASLVKRMLPEAIVGSGGGLFSSVGAELLRMIPDLDVGFKGEGEISLDRFAESVQCTADLTDFKISNVVTRTHESGYSHDNGDVPALDDIPLPDFEGWMLERYLENPPFPTTPNLANSKRRASMILSRGCPFSCDHCANTLKRRDIRFRSVDNLFNEIDILVNRYGVDYIFFNDETFLVPHKCVSEFLDRYHKGNYRFRWCISTRSSLVNKETLQELAQANCDFIYFGFESGSQMVLDAMGKRTTVERNFEAFVDAVEAGIYCKPNLIIGYDNETEESVRETFDFLRRLEGFGRTIENQKTKNIFQQSLNNFEKIYYATPYPGTPLYQRTKQRIPFSMQSCLERIAYKDAFDLTINISPFEEKRLQQRVNDLTNYVRNISL